MKRKKFIIIFVLLFISISILSCGNTENTKKGFYATIKIVNADGSQADTYKFVDSNALGSYGGIINLLSFSATQKSYQNPNNKDTISFSYEVWDEDLKNLTNIPPEGVKLPISRKGRLDKYVFVGYVESYDTKGPVSSDDIVDSVESSSYLIISSFEQIGELEYLLIGSVRCTLILKDGSRRIIEGEFSIPIDQAE